nr:polymer-forming cytoskeletal protein [Desulfobacterales bacterium]
MAKKDKGLSIIDKDFEVEGILKIKGKLIVYGTVRGTIDADNLVTVEGSRVFAKAKVQNMTIGGVFEGDVTAYGKLKLIRTGSFSGKITCNTLSIEAGGKLDGIVEPIDSKATLSPTGIQPAPEKRKDDTSAVESDTGTNGK